MPQRPSKIFSYTLLSGILAFGFFGIFILPWFLPPTRIVVSDSYNMGFNNTVAMLALGITLLLLIGWRLLDSRSDGEPPRERLPFGDSFTSDSGKTKPDRLTIAIVSGVCLLAVALNLGWWLYLPLNYTGEMISFLPCIELVLMGKTPYTQFQFNYGPLYLYLPVGIVLWSGSMVGSEIGYLVTHLIFLVVGLLLVAYVTSILPQRQRLLLFGLIALPFVMNISLGSNYTPIRFILPYAALLWIHRQCEKHFKISPSTFAWKIALSVSVAIICCFSVSPETGVIFSLASLVYFGFLVRGQSRTSQIIAALYAFSGTAVGFIFLAIVSNAYFVSILSFGGGGFNFPIVPGSFIILYLCCLAWVVPSLASWGLRHQGPQASLTLAWAAMITLLAAPALGRCDGGHIFCNGLGAFIAFFALLPERPQAVRWLTYGAFAAVFTAGLPYISYLLFKETIAEATRLNNRGLQKADRRFWLPISDPLTLALESDYHRDLGTYPHIGTPFGTHEPLEIYLKRNKKYVPEFYSAPAGGAFTLEQVTAKCSEVDKMPIILVPASSLNDTWTPQLEENFTREQQKTMRRLLLYPITYHWTKEPLIPDVMLAQYIRDRFTVVRKWKTYYIMGRNDLIKTKPRR